MLFFSGIVSWQKEKKGLYIYIVGPEDQIKEELAKYEYPAEQIEIVHAPDEITCHDSPVNAIRQKKESSMVVALRMVKEGKADGFVLGRRYPTELYTGSPHV